MSINSLSPEVLVNIFSHLHDIRTKIRLKRVSKKFRDCINSPDSWKNDNTLRLYNFSIYGLRSFLKHAVEINTLDLTEGQQRTLMLGSVNLRFLSEFWSHTEKLKITELICINNCTISNRHLVSYCFGKFHASITKIDFSCKCRAQRLERYRVHGRALPAYDNLLCCSMQQELFDLVSSCDKLTSVKLHGLQLNENQKVTVLRNFHRKPIKHISLDLCCGGKQLDNGTALAALLNSRNCVESLSITCPSKFTSANLCTKLRPRAARTLAQLYLKVPECDFVIVLATLPVLVPGLQLLEIDNTGPLAETVSPLDISRAVGEFLHAAKGREPPIELKLMLLAAKEMTSFVSDLWKAVDLLTTVRSGTRRTRDMNKWSRTLKDGNATVNISVRLSA